MDFDQLIVLSAFALAAGWSLYVFVTNKYW